MNYIVFPGLEHKKAITPEMIFEVVLQQYDISEKEYHIHQKSRKQPYVLIRQIRAYFLRKKCNMTLEKVGDLINRDHATVIHAEKVIDDILSINQQPHSTKIRKIETRLKNITEPWNTIS